MTSARTPLSRCLVAECFGTFALVFIGTGAIVMNDVSGGVITHVGVALAFGLVVMAMIDAIGDVSGAHINPAVTVAFALAKRFPWSRVAPYIGAQVAGAILASLTLRAIFTDHPTLGATIPSGAHAQSFALEIILTLILMFVILRVATGAKERGILAMRRDRGRRRLRSHGRRTHQRRIHEPCAILRARAGLDERKRARIALDLSGRAGARRSARRSA